VSALAWQLGGIVLVVIAPLNHDLPNEIMKATCDKTADMLKCFGTMVSRRASALAPPAAPLSLRARVQPCVHASGAGSKHASDGHCLLGWLVGSVPPASSPRWRGTRPAEPAVCSDSAEHDRAAWSVGVSRCGSRPSRGRPDRVLQPPQVDRPARLTFEICADADALGSASYYSSLLRWSVRRGDAPR
jgi:hypothetical protein